MNLRWHSDHKFTAVIFIRNWLPSALKLIQPYFDSAEDILKHCEGYAEWGKHVRILSRTQPLIPAQIENEVLEVIYESLFRQKQFRGRYRKRDGTDAEYVFHPLGLIFREIVIYLVATVWEYKDQLHFALHRFKHCEQLADKAVPPEGFDFDEYIAKGSFEYADNEGKKIKLIALFSDGTAEHLAETPLSADQEMTKKKDGRIEIKATVTDSSQLRWWLLGFGHYVDVVKPKRLRDEFKEISKNMVECYYDVE